MTRPPPAIQDRAARLRLDLRRRIAGHNREVMAVTLFCLLSAAALWCLAGFVLYWLTLLGLTISEGLRGRDARDPTHFAGYFAAIAIGGLLIALLIRRLPKLRRDPRFPNPAAFAEILLIPPLATLSIWENASATIRLRRGELDTAADLLVALSARGPIPLAALPAQIVSASSRARILAALQLLQLATIKSPRDAEPDLRLCPSKARTIPALRALVR